MIDVKKQFFLLSQRRDFFLFFLGVVFIFIFGLLGLAPLFSSTTGVWTQLAFGKDYETALIQKIESVNQAKRNLAAISNQIEEIDDAVPDGSSQPKLIQEFSLDAGRAGVSIISIFFRERETFGLIESEAFSLTVSGTEGRLVDFLRGLEKDRLIKFDRVQAVRRREGGSETFMTTVEGKSFYIQ